MKKLLNRQESLAKAFWLYFMLLGFGINVVLKLVVPALGGSGEILTAAWIVRAVHIYGMTYLVWINAPNCENKVWMYVARAMMVIVAVLETIRLGTAWMFS